MHGNIRQLITYLATACDETKEYEIKEYKSKRNNNQNAKYYKLLNELALNLKISVEKLHFEMLKYYSVRYQVCVPHGQELRGIKYYELQGIRQNNGKLYDVYNVYTPSHELNTKEFSFLLGGLVQECVSAGIETLSPDEFVYLNALEGDKNEKHSTKK